VAHRIEYSPETESHLRALTAAQRSLVLSTVKLHLAQEPTVETRNRKPMRPNLLATWELRIRNPRVYYTVDAAPPHVVSIRAVGVKVRNRVRIANREIEL
jgi:mRNA-degrading endonuclease RelE of RelBE toxin-antitoxin system